MTTKDRRIPAPQDVPRIFSDDQVRQLAAVAKLPADANLPHFATAVRDAALLYIRDASTASDNEVHHGVDVLLRAADRALIARKRKDAAYENVAVRIEIDPQRWSDALVRRVDALRELSAQIDTAPPTRPAASPRMPRRP